MRDVAAADPSSPAFLAATPADVLRGALIDSRHRWRELIGLAADFAFETDEWGRFSLVMPDPALGWVADTLIGLPASSILSESGGSAFDPFRVTSRVRHRQAWLRRADGGNACMTFHAAPILDQTGGIVGARGVGIDMTESDAQSGHVASALRRAEVLDHILRRMGQEVLIPRMMTASLDRSRERDGRRGGRRVPRPLRRGGARVASGRHRGRAHSPGCRHTARAGGKLTQHHRRPRTAGNC